eukprot:gene8451-17423_t
MIIASTLCSVSFSKNSCVALARLLGSQNNEKETLVLLTEYILPYENVKQLGLNSSKDIVVLTTFIMETTKMITRIIVLLICIISQSSCEKTNSLDELKHILYPFTPASVNSSTHIHMRGLVVRPHDTNPNCPKCYGLKYCSILNGYMVEEVYISKQYYVGSAVVTKGTCSVYEALGKQMYNEIFGKGKPFNDDSQCREMVMQYLCLFWASDNYMYRNSCIDKEDTTGPDPADHRLSPRYPCRSFCIQIAKVCANEYDFMKVCSEIACPPTDSKCTP